MKKTWAITEGEQNHTVSVRRNLFGCTTVTIDGDEFKIGHVSAFTERNEPFRVGESQCMLMMKGNRVDIKSNDCEIVLV